VLYSDVILTIHVFVSTCNQFILPEICALWDVPQHEHIHSVFLDERWRFCALYRMYCVYIIMLSKLVHYWLQSRDPEAQHTGCFRQSRVPGLVTSQSRDFVITKKPLN